MLSSQPAVLGVQLNWLLAADLPRDLPRALKPRAACLPIAQQHTLALDAAALLTRPSTVACSAACLREQLQELLVVLANGTKSRGANINATAGNRPEQQVQFSTQTACWVLQQQQQQEAGAASGTQTRPLWTPPAPAPLPAWLSPSPQHCCSWLASPAATKQAPAAAGVPQSRQHPSALGRAAPPVGASLSQQPAGPGGDQQQTRHQDETHHVFTNPGAAAHQSDASGDEDVSAPAAKRSRRQLEQAVPAAQGGPQEALLSADTAAVAVLWQPVLSQLQDFSSSGDATKLDLHQLAGVLSSAAAAAAAQPSDSLPGLQQLHEQLQQLTVELAHVLVGQLLHACSPSANHNSSSSGDGGRGDPQDSSSPLTDAGLGYLLTHSLLPRLQALRTAAPQSMLMCLTTLGRSRAQAVLQDTVLAPLVVNAALLPVQVQLLAKLAKDVDTLQPRLLELLLSAALGGTGSNQSPMQHPGRSVQVAYQAGVFAGSSSNCCWLEPHVNLFKALTDSTPQLIAQQLPLVLQAMQAAVQQPVVAKSAAFGQVLMTILKNYGGSCTQQQVEQLQGVASRTATFLTKSLSSKLQQLQQQHAAAAMQ